MTAKHLVSIADLTVTDVEAIFARARELKARPRAEGLLARRVLAMVFEKPSLRTRVSFETGMVQLGGHAIYLAPGDIKLGARESVADVALNLSRLADGIMARTFAHETVVALAEHAGVPVINGLSDREHPCQALADFLTILEHKGLGRSTQVAYVGDGNNVCHSLMLLAEKLGQPLRVATPAGYEPDQEVRAACPSIGVTNHAGAAVDGADVVYTDVWASMGQEDSAAQRRAAFAAYQVNADLMSHAKPDAIFLHCLPAHRGEEVTSEVIDGPQSVVYDQAENRLHAQKALLVGLLA